MLSGTADRVTKIWYEYYTTNIAICFLFFVVVLFCSLLWVSIHFGNTAAATAVAADVGLYCFVRQIEYNTNMYISISTCNKQNKYTLYNKINTIYTHFK